MKYKIDFEDDFIKIAFLQKKINKIALRRNVLIHLRGILNR